MLSVKLAWRNLLRYRLRTFITLMAVSLGLMLVQTYHNFTTGVYSYMIETGVRSGSGHLVLCRDNYLASHHSGLFFSSRGLPEKVARIDGVQEVLARTHLPGLAQSSRDNRNIHLVGVDVAKEMATNPYLKDVPHELSTKPWKSSEALIGSGLMRELKIDIGRKFVVTVQGQHGELVSELFRVRDVINTGIRDIDRSLVMVSRQKAASMVGAPDAVHEIAVVLEDAGLAETVYPAVERLLAARPGLKVFSWEEAMPNLYNAIRWDYVTINFLSMIVLVIVTIGVVNTLLMSVMERINELGVLRAIGTSPGRLQRMIVGEALLLGCLAVVLGTALGAIATGYLVHYGFDLRLFIPENLEFGGVLFSALLYARWDVGWMIESSVYMLLLCVIASIYPAIKASKVTPVEALRHL